MRNFIYLQILIGLLFLTSSCQSQSAQTIVNSAENKTNSQSNSSINSNASEPVKKTGEIVESFSDDAKIGVPHKNKIEIDNYKKQNGNVAVIKFYSLGENKEWKLSQSFEYEKDDTTECSPEIKDFNNDGFADVTYVSDIAARGANEVRKLFIYDRKSDQLIYIKNSEEYPNLLYNKTLNCLDAQLFYGGTMTAFLRIEGDQLKRFAYVEMLDNVRKVYSVNKNSKERLLQTDKIAEKDAYERYKTFNPPRVYTAKELKR